ncbi:glutaminase A [Flavobacterium ginsenosidimutans]|uniref:glutaminase A n=1 Tax=Flavobacterium ginsenosidimutans TaxID=687844 RepID=UPI000DAE9D85|nr:glutaminase A [Flavobacterium ginsenosidimutans]KAF2338803.1 glutaminase A [Flavobacterium ginsenosidimutans]
MKTNLRFIILIILMLVNPLFKAIAQKELSYQAAIDHAYDKYKNLQEGKNADYIKELANVDPNIFGIAIVTTDGKVYSKGDLGQRVSIQSISKVFTLARLIEEQGPRAVAEKIGVDATGLRFNSIVAVELQKGKEINPLVNPGAIAAVSLVKGNDSVAKWKNILDTHNAFAGTKLLLNKPVYISEAGDNLRNQAIAHLLLAYGRMYFDPVQSTDIYTKQCAINVNAKELAVMASTLANGGVNPVTKEKVVSPETCAFTMGIMSTAGLYDDSGQWLYAVGLPAKSGVGGGLIAVCPGKFGIAVISPPLNAAGNSVKAQKAIFDIAKELGVNPFIVTPKK